jgi:hypothetical protein
MDESKTEPAVTPREDKDRGKDITTPKLGETNPQNYPGSDFSFTLQAVFEMKGTLHELKKSIETLTEQSKESRDKLSKLSHTIYAVSAVVTVLGIIGGFVIKALWDLISPILRSHLH